MTIIIWIQLTWWHKGKTSRRQRSQEQQKIWARTASPSWIVSSMMKGNYLGYSRREVGGHCNDIDTPCSLPGSLLSFNLLYPVRLQWKGPRLLAGQVERVPLVGLLDGGVDDVLLLVGAPVDRVAQAKVDATHRHHEQHKIDGGVHVSTILPIHWVDQICEIISFLYFFSHLNRISWWSLPLFGPQVEALNTSESNWS